MIFDQALYDFLTNDATALIALIGSRVYINQLPQEPTFPALVYSTVGVTPYSVISGKSSMDKVRCQFDCWGNDPLEAKQVSRELRNSLEGFIGTMGDITVRSVLPIVLDGDDFDTITSNGYRVISEYYFNHV